MNFTARQQNDSHRNKIHTMYIMLNDAPFLFGKSYSSTFLANEKHQAGFSLDLVQRGKNPSDWKPMKTIGAGVTEIRVHVEGEFRVIYVAIAKNAYKQTTYQVTIMETQTFTSVWDAIESDPITAQNMKLRSELMIAITTRIKERAMNQQQAADTLEVTQPRISALINGKIDQFRLDMLVNMALKLGLQVDIRIAT